MLRKNLNPFHTRRTERAPMKAAVSFRNRQGETSYGWSRDISLGGLYVHTDDRERIGTLCDLKLTIKQDEGICRMTVRGQVARYDPDGIAFQFCDLSDESRATIRVLVEEHLRAAFGPPPSEDGADDDAEDAGTETPQAAEADPPEPAAVPPGDAEPVPAAD